MTSRPATPDEIRKVYEEQGHAVDFRNGVVYVKLKGSDLWAKDRPASDYQMHPEFGLHLK